MSILSKPLRPSSTTADDAVRRYIAVARRHAEPDPLFRRGLRGTIMNRHVAVREGAIAPRAARRASRTGRLGRACLYASFAMAVSVGGAMAASERALPGELLYPLKRSIESLRLEVLPQQFHDELVADALSARIQELAVLLDAGEVALAASVSDDVRESYEALLALGVGEDARRGLLQARFAQLEAMLARLPDAARTAVERATVGTRPFNAAPGLGTGPEPGSPVQGEGPRGPLNEDGAAGQGTERPTNPARTPEPQPSATPKPERTPKAEPTPKPEPTQKSKPGADAEPEPISDPEPEPDRVRDAAPGSEDS